MLAAGRWKQVMGLGHARSLQSVQGPRFQHLNKHVGGHADLCIDSLLWPYLMYWCLWTSSFKPRKKVERIPEKNPWIQNPQSEPCIPGPQGTFFGRNVIQRPSRCWSLSNWCNLKCRSIFNPRSMPYDSKKCIGKAHLHSLWQFWKSHQKPWASKSFLSLLQRNVLCIFNV